MTLVTSSRGGASVTYTSTVPVVFDTGAGDEVGTGIAHELANRVTILKNTTPKNNLALTIFILLFKFLYII